MSNQWIQPNQYDDDDDDDGQSQQQQPQQIPKGLRTHVTKLEKELAALKEENGKLKVQVRESAISKVLTTKGIDERVAKLVPTDIEPTSEAVEKWLTDHGDLFATKQQEPNPGKSGDSQTPTPTGDDPDDEDFAELIAAMGRINRVNDVAQPPTKAADLLAVLKDKSLTAEKLNALVNAAGGGVGSG
jgi:hypothetical protein